MFFCPKIPQNKKLEMNKLQLLLIGAILFISVLLRLNNYTQYPQRGATSDEYTYSFLGISLIKDKIPISWSTFQSYKQREDLTIRGIYFPIVKPYFDHPPLYALLVGGWALISSEDTFQKISLETIRLVPVFLGTISSLLVFLIANKIYGFKVALWSLMIFSTVTIFIMNMRVSVSENLLTVFFLSAVYLFERFKNKFNANKIIFISVVCGLCLLTKIMGIAAFFFTLYLLLDKRLKHKFLIIFSLVFLTFPVILFSYAAYFDWNLFWAIQNEQATRMIGPQTVLNLFRNPVIVNKQIFDGWYFLGFIALFWSFVDYKKNKLIIVPSLVYLLLLISSLTREGLSGWYMIPLFPFMAIATANMLSESFNKISLGFLTFILFVGMWQIEKLFEEPFGLTPLVFRVILFLLFFPLLAFGAFRQKKHFVALSNLLFYLFIIGNVAITLSYQHPS